MMALRLEVFETPDDDLIVTDRTAQDEARRVAFDDGFAAGRAAARAEAEATAAGQAAEVARHLQEIAFTFHEARAHVLDGLKPLLMQMAETVLPALARESLPLRLADLVLTHAATLADAPLRLIHHPDAADVVAQFAAGAALPILPVADPSLEAGVVRLVSGGTETRVDLARATDEILAAIRGFYTLAEQDRKYG